MGHVWTGLKRAFALAEGAVFGPLTFLGLSTLAAPLATLELPGVWGAGLFVALASVGLFSGRDFSFLRAPLAWATAASVVTLVASALLGRSPGALFAFTMVACGALATLEQTGAVRRGWRPLPYLGPALRLLARPVFAPVPALGRGLVAASKALCAPLAWLRRGLDVCFPRQLPDGLRSRR